LNTLSTPTPPPPPPSSSLGEQSRIIHLLFLLQNTGSKFAFPYVGTEIQFIYTVAYFCKAVAAVCSTF
jgi:hypothetical protein